MIFNTSIQKRGVCIFARNNMEFDDINLEKLCDEKTSEICAIKITVKCHKTNSILHIQSSFRKREQIL
jgi:hypothetical protein